jgi:hypothetical protein
MGISGPTIILTVPVLYEMFSGLKAKLSALSQAPTALLIGPIGISITEMWLPTDGARNNVLTGSIPDSDVGEIVGWWLSLEGG